MKERVTAMDQVMVVSMMATEAANLVLFVEVTIAENLVFIIMKKMTVVSSHQQLNLLIPHKNLQKAYG